MSLEALNHRTLVLNKNWMAINTINVREAMGKVVSGVARILGKDYQMHDFDSWVKSWEDVKEVDKLDNKFINCVRFKVRVPEVIILSDYKGYRLKDARFSRRNIFLRDKSTCQYCYSKFPTKELNIDHVMPRSRGGKTSWTNVVLSCLKCNTFKAARTPEEAGMKLLKEPLKPHWTQLSADLGRDIPDLWKSFVDSVYWNTELSEEL